MLTSLTTMDKFFVERAQDRLDEAEKQLLDLHARLAVLGNVVPSQAYDLIGRCRANIQMSGESIQCIGRE